MLNIQVIRNAILALETCPLKNSGIRPVMPVGDGSSGILLIGEAPGAKEDEIGEPFVGASGRLLNNILLPSVGLTRETIYLTNIVKCRPPNNRDPKQEEKDSWTPVLELEVDEIKPNLVVCLGRHSMGYFLPQAKISEVHGKIQTVLLGNGRKINLLPLYHPAAALYNPNMLETLKADFLIIKPYMDKVREIQSKLLAQSQIL
jgi:uracil-DNA glycosylase